MSLKLIFMYNILLELCRIEPMTLEMDWALSQLSYKSFDKLNLKFMDIKRCSFIEKKVTDKQTHEQ